MITRINRREPPHQQIALKRGVDDLYCSLEWLLRERPRTLAPWRREYRHFALRLLRAVIRAAGDRE